MRAWLVVLVLASMLTGFASAASLTSRYGVVSAEPSLKDPAAYIVALDGQTITKVAAENVSLYRVKHRGADEFIIVETWAPALNCHLEYFLVTIHRDKSFTASPQFGACSELDSGSPVTGGVKVVLAPVVSPRARKTFLWIRGKLSER